MSDEFLETNFKSLLKLKLSSSGVMQILKKELIKRNLHLNNPELFI